MEFGNKRKEARRQADGAKFMAQAKADHAAVFDSYIELQDEFDNVESYTRALQADAWKVTEQIAKQSWRNGIARGKAMN